MVILLYFSIMKALPKIGAYAQALLEPTMIIVITLAGIVMLFGAVGMKISSNLGATIVKGIFRAIGYCCNIIIRSLRWIILNIFRMIPRVFNGSRQIFSQMGINALVSNLLAAFIVTIVLIIIV